MLKSHIGGKECISIYLCAITNRRDGRVAASPSNGAPAIIYDMGGQQWEADGVVNREATCWTGGNEPGGCRNTPRDSDTAM